MKEKDTACREHRMIFIRKVPAKFDKEFWEAQFSACGEIQRLVIFPDKNHERKFMVYSLQDLLTCRQIIFKTAEGAKQALQILGSKGFIETGIYAALASPRNEMPKKQKNVKKPSMDVRL